MKTDIIDILNGYRINDEIEDDLAEDLADYTKQAILDHLDDIKTYLEDTEWDLKH